MSPPDLINMTCAQFTELSAAEQQAFVIGVANGRGMTAGLFRAYAAAAQTHAANPEEGAAIAASFATINSMLLPLLELDAVSLLNGIRVACTLPEFRDKYVINALASVHLDVAKALQHQYQRSGA